MHVIHISYWRALNHLTALWYCFRI